VDNNHVREDYENHYSPRLNKCFYLEKSATSENSGWTIGLALYDLNENKPYGRFTSGPYGILDCKVKDKVCRSEQEWRELAKPFLEEDAPEKSIADPAASAPSVPHRGMSDKRMTDRAMSDEPRSRPSRRLVERCGFRWAHHRPCCTSTDPDCRFLLRRPMYF
jgi:hypothetical protein